MKVLCCVGKKSVSDVDVMRVVAVLHRSTTAGKGVNYDWKPAMTDQAVLYPISRSKEAGIRYHPRMVNCK